MKSNLIMTGKTIVGQSIRLENLEIRCAGFRVLLRVATLHDLPLIEDWWHDRHAEINYNRRRTLADASRIKRLRGCIPTKYAERTSSPDKLVCEIPFMIVSEVHQDLGDPIGIIVLSNIDWVAREAETRTFIEGMHKYVMNGPEAKVLLLKFVFEVLGFAKMHAWFIGKPSDEPQASLLNDPSYKFNFKCGFRVVPDDTRKGFVQRGNRKYDLVHMIMLSKWWPQAYRSYQQKKRIGLKGPRVFRYNSNCAPRSS